MIKWFEHLGRTNVARLKKRVNRMKVDVTRRGLPKRKLTEGVKEPVQPKALSFQGSERIVRNKSEWSMRRVNALSKRS